MVLRAILVRGEQDLVSFLARIVEIESLIVKVQDLHVGTMELKSANHRNIITDGHLARINIYASCVDIN